MRRLMAVMVLNACTLLARHTPVTNLCLVVRPRSSTEFWDLGVKVAKAMRRTWKDNVNKIWACKAWILSGIPNMELERHAMPSGSIPSYTLIRISAKICSWLLKLPRSREDSFQHHCRSPIQATTNIGLEPQHGASTSLSIGLCLARVRFHNFVECQTCLHLKTHFFTFQPKNGP